MDPKASVIKGLLQCCTGSSALNYWIKQIIIATLIFFIVLKTFDHLNLTLFIKIFCWHIASLKILIS